jgi:phosphatidylinositol alpha-1,6-mannosyltransferase
MTRHERIESNPNIMFGKPVATEAAGHGLPTLAYATAGVTDAVTHDQSGYRVPAGRYGELAAADCRVLAAGREAPPRGQARQFASNFTWDDFALRLRQALQGTPATTLRG